MRLAKDPSVSIPWMSSIPMCFIMQNRFINGVFCQVELRVQMCLCIGEEERVDCLVYQNKDGTCDRMEF